MRRSRWTLHFVRDNEQECWVRIKVFVGSIFAGSICQNYVDGMWIVNLFEDFNTLHFTDCFEGKKYKTLLGAKIAASQWIRRNWSVNLKGEKK